MLNSGIGRTAVSSTAKTGCWSCIDQLTPLAESLQLSACLKPLDSLLVDGNQAMRWEAAHGQGQSIENLLQEGIQRMEEEERISTGEACLG